MKTTKSETLMKTSNEYRFKFRIRFRKSLYGFKSVKTDFVWQVFGDSKKECIKKLMYIHFILFNGSVVKGPYEECIYTKFRNHLRSLNLSIDYSDDFDFIIDMYHEGKWYIYSENNFHQEYYKERGEFILP